MRSPPSAAMVGPPPGSAPRGDASSVRLGDRIRVWWPLDKEFYNGTVVSYDEEKERWSVIYDDGDAEKINLLSEHWSVLPPGVNGEPPHEDLPPLIGRDVEHAGDKRKREAGWVAAKEQAQPKQSKQGKVHSIVVRGPAPPAEQGTVAPTAQYQDQQKGGGQPREVRSPKRNAAIAAAAGITAAMSPSKQKALDAPATINGPPSGGLDVDGWLAAEGFPKVYSVVFARHNVTIDLLTELTYEDLAEIGVIKVGDRRRMWLAIRRFASKSV